MKLNVYLKKAYENKSNWTLGENKPNSNPIAERVKLMQSLYLQRIMKKYAAKGYEKTNPILPAPEGGKTQVRGRISFLCLLFPDEAQIIEFSPQNKEKPCKNRNFPKLDNFIVNFADYNPWDQLFFAYFAFLGFFGSLGFFTFLAFGAFGTF